MRGFWKWASCLSVMGITSAHAFIPFAPNENLIEEVRNQNYRLLPKSETYALAVDADFFKPIIFRDPNSLYYEFDEYHGNGYWTTIRAELKPIHDLTFNIKTIITQGTSSNGPTYNAIIVPLVGITIEKTFGEVKLKARLSDAGRQTLGAGLFVEDKLTSGGYLTASSGQAFLNVMVDGTGSYRLDGGMVAFDFSLWNHWLGTTVFFQENDPTFSPPSFVGTLYSKKEWDNGLGYGFEYGEDQVNWGVLAYGIYRQNAGRFHVWFKPQFRHYGAGILGKLPGRVEHNYVGYDENDKAYTNIMDIFAGGDSVNAYSAQLNGEFIINPFYLAYAETEGVFYDYHHASLTRNVFFRTGFKFFPFHGREDFIGALIGNKYLIASTTDAVQGRNFSQPNTPDLENKPLFMNQLYVMLNLAVKF